MPRFNHSDLVEPLEIAHSVYTFRSTSEIPERFREIFSCYPYFNSVQSRVLDDVLYSDKSLVVAAPTGSGKTVVFELAMVSLLMKLENMSYDGDFKVVYIAPIKALCSEKYQDWCKKFSKFGLRTLEITGDTDSSAYSVLQDYHLIITTPEKWDSLTRKWKDNKHLMQVVKLILIDEVHLLNDESRGPTMEAVVSRMKTVQGTILHDFRMHQASLIRKEGEELDANYLDLRDIRSLPVRFIAVSACIPNIEDAATWLGDGNCPAVAYKFSEDTRPVKLKKVVLGFNCPDSWTPFRFSITLMYKLKSILLSHADGKPTLIFCSTRKGVIQTSMVLFKDITFQFTQDQRERLYFASNQISEKKMKDLLLSGIGCHHAGMIPNDRFLVEDLFRAGFLPILIATSTLAMGVNLPAHLVIIMSTDQFIRGAYQEYPESQILQMIGRAGRPQFDTSAVAVIMTKNSLKQHYERLVEGRQTLESNLHHHLTEHLNAEIVLHTITDLAVAMDWIHSTFLYVCASRRPTHYSLVCQPCTAHKIESKLQELCIRELNALASCGIINLDGMDVKPTEMGRLMARYCVAFETMKLFKKVTGTESVIDLIRLLSKSAEYSDIQLRANERKTLNCLNKNKGHECIRYPILTRVKTRDQKIDILIQSTFGCLQIQDSGLSQDCLKIMRIAQRVSKCFYQYVLNCLVKEGKNNCYKIFLNTLRLSKCFNSRLWEDSIFVARQLDGIGPSYAGLLAASGKTSFAALRGASPRDIERILNKAPPFGNDIKDVVNHLPEYKLSIDKSGHIITVGISVNNWEIVRQYISSGGSNNFSTLIAGDPSTNSLLLHETISDACIVNSRRIIKTINLRSLHNVKEVKIHLINENWVGLDVEASIELDGEVMKSESVREYLKRFAFSQGNSSEKAVDIKAKTGIEKKVSSSQSSKKNNAQNLSYVDKLKVRAQMLSGTPSLKLKKEAHTPYKFQKSIEMYFSKGMKPAEATTRHGIMEEVCVLHQEEESHTKKRFKEDTLEIVNNDDISTTQSFFSGSSQSQADFCDYGAFINFQGNGSNALLQVTQLHTPVYEPDESFVPNEDDLFDTDEFPIAENMGSRENGLKDTDEYEPQYALKTGCCSIENLPIPNFNLGENLLLEEEL